MPPIALCGLMLLLACERDGAPQDRPFDGEQALAYIRQVLEFGTRVPGSIGHAKAGDWIVGQMRQRADTVIEQRWTHVTARGDSLPMRNILARYKPEATDRILYLTHWDTRPRAEKESDRGKRNLPIVGANDGTSGIGLFLALGDLLKKTPPSVGVDLLFVDGEDYGDFDRMEDVLIGSMYFAEHLPSANYQILYGVLWDMIGDANLRLLQEGNSMDMAPEVVARVWQTAARLGHQRYFVSQAGDFVTDDHVPLLRKGLRVIDVIDFEYDAHHTTRDTIDKVSARSLKIVGDVAYELVR